VALPSRVTPVAQPIAFDWVTIPAGEFLMGSDKQKDKLASDDEVPQHTVTLPTFRIGRYPVTNGEYAVFVNATGQPAPPHWLGIQPPFDLRDHPVVAIGWHDAVAFCTWLSQKRGTEIRLPSEAEWERAARDTDGRIYPWGNDFDAARCNMADTGIGDTTSVGIFSAGNAVCGAADMAGNVLEWTSSLWGKDSSKPKFGYPYDPKDGRENQSAPDTMLRVLRGGSFYHRVQDVRCAARHSSYPRGIRLSFLGGFRIVSPGS
jgi:formylglycine-generating enzyme required for sulfatase activity